MSDEANGNGQLGDLSELVGAARRMADGEFRELITIEAKGEIGQLAFLINQTMQKLQQFDPTVVSSSQSLPQMSGQLSEVIKATEQASMQVLNEIEQMMDEQMVVGKGLRQLSTLLEAEQARDPQLGATITMLEDLRVHHSRSQGRAMEIMGAMEFQDITTQRITKSLNLISDIQNRLVRLLVIFNISEKGVNESKDDDKWKVSGGLVQESGEIDQKTVDQILAEFGPSAQ